MNENLAAEKIAGILARTNPNLDAFAEYLLGEAQKSGAIPAKPSAAVRDAFLLAARSADRAYAVYQAAKPTSSRYVAPEPVAAPKPSGRKVRSGSAGTTAAA